MPSLSERFDKLPKPRLNEMPNKASAPKKVRTKKPSNPDVIDSFEPEIIRPQVNQVSQVRKRKNPNVVGAQLVQNQRQRMARSNHGQTGQWADFQPSSNDNSNGRVQSLVTNRGRGFNEQSNGRNGYRGDPIQKPNGYRSYHTQNGNIRVQKGPYQRPQKFAAPRNLSKGNGNGRKGGRQNGYLQNKRSNYQKMKGSPNTRNGNRRSKNFKNGKKVSGNGSVEWQQEKKKELNEEDLDKDLESYLMKSDPQGYLDKELDDYFNQGNSNGKASKSKESDKAEA